MVEDSRISAGPTLVRETYLERLRPWYDDCDTVKVITGVRRCGKSVLLRQIAEELRKQAPGRVIEANFEIADVAGVRDGDDLDRFVMSQVDGPGIHYVLLDEVQEVAGFEKGVNSLRARGGVSVFISGSNAHVLSGDLATYLAGRYREVRVWPLSYPEALQWRDQRGLSSEDALADYLARGGMPHRFGLAPEEAHPYLRDVFNSVVLRDVVQRTGVRDVAGLEAIIDFACENLGRVMSPTSIAGYLASRRRTVATETVYAYLRALTDALLLNRVRRFDVRGKKVMATLDKYYATDVGVLASKRVGSGSGIGDRVENAVYTHLAARGYDVYTGLTPTGEIDFVAVKGGRPRYVQAAYLLAGDDVAAREYGAFDGLRDGYPRFIITLDPLTRDRDGVTHLRLEDFLLHPPPDLA